MLCNLSDVLWQGEAKWQPPSMGDLIDEGQLRKHYMKACRVVHPDKQAGQSVERRFTAGKLFDLLNKSWEKHKQGGSQQTRMF
mmetsp:Transcript_14639/g.37391  ORF Transcript_14639/g.37391 Transcript_14639/m.37391 type:complete len:83 (+) Transcript_14639:1423-1671(+)